jgi:hypothetical protein
MTDLNYNLLWRGLLVSTSSPSAKSILFSPTIRVPLRTTQAESKHANAKK